MGTLPRVENKISSIRKYLQVLDRFGKYTKEQIKGDEIICGAVERYLYLVVQASIDLAEAYLSMREFRKPTTYRESFEILAENDVISKTLLGKMGGMVGFRNIMAHDYGDVDYDIVYSVLTEGVHDVEEFIKQVEAVL